MAGLRWALLALAATLALTLPSGLVPGVQAQVADTSSPGSITGTLMVMMLSTVSDGTDDSRYYLHAEDGQIYRLSFCKSVTVEGLPPNSRVTVSYSSIAEGVMYSCKRPQQHQERRMLFGDTIDGPTAPTFLVYVVTMCGYSQPAAATTDMVYDMFTGNGTYSSGHTMQGYYDTCSYGKVNVQKSHVKALGPIQIPCSGQLDLTFKFPSGNGFDTRSCNNDNLLKWHYYLDSVAAKQGVTATDYHHKIILFPTGLTSKFAGCNGVPGTSSVGPWIRDTSDTNKWGTGLVWMSGDVFGNLELLFHEIGHNLGMAHASVPGGCDLVDQCDHTCPMGATGGQGIRCLNPPHLWQLGWGQPAKQLGDADLPIGAHIPLHVTPQTASPTSFFTVALEAMPANQQLYFAARSNVYAYDLPYTKAQDGQPFITVHSYSGTPGNPYVRTLLLQDVPLGASFTDTQTGLVASFADWDAKGGATISLCLRRDTKEQICGDGLDDDCDGIPDEQDPDCVGRMPPPPAKSSSNNSNNGKPTAADTSRSPPSPPPRSPPSPPPTLPRPPPRAKPPSLPSPTAPPQHPPQRSPRPPPHQRRPRPPPAPGSSGSFVIFSSPSPSSPSAPPPPPPPPPPPVQPAQPPVSSKGNGASSPPPPPRPPRPPPKPSTLLELQPANSGNLFASGRRLLRK